MKNASLLFSEKENWILDGGLATELEKRGVDLNHKLWSARALKDKPEAIFDTHLSYLEAGADIILTSSYQASIKGFMQYGMYNREARETIFSSVMLACYAKEKYFETHEKRPVLIGGSCGPYGAYLADGSEYTGAYESGSGFEKNLAEYYFDKIEVLLSPRRHYQVDFLLFETLPLLKEAQFILSHMRKYSGAPVVFSFSRAEVAYEAAKVFAKDPQVAAIGINCMSAENTTAALRELATRSVKPLFAYPNGGGTYDSKTKKWSADNQAGPAQTGRNQSGTDQSNWAEFIKTCDELNVKVRGGCCRTTPDDIKAIRSITTRN